MTDGVGVVEGQRAEGGCARACLRIARRSAPRVDVIEVVDGREERVRGGELRVEFDRALEQRSRFRVRLLRRSLPQRAAPQVGIVGFDVISACGGDAMKIARVEADRERRDDLGRYVVLHREDVGELSVESLGPDVPARRSDYELRGDPDTAAGPPHAALKHMTYAEGSRDFCHEGVPALEREGRISRDYEKLRQLR